MVRYRRHPLAGGTFFFTVALADRTADTLTASIGLLRAAFRRVRAERAFGIDAIVILPDHLHTVMTLPPNDAAFSMRWQRIKTVSTQSLDVAGLARRDNTGRMLWQRRFWEHTIRDASDFDRHIDYIHFNPVKHGYVQSPAAWPYSSLHHFIRQGIVPPDWGGNRDADADTFGERGGA